MNTHPTRAGGAALPRLIRRLLSGTLLVTSAHAVSALTLDDAIRNTINTHPSITAHSARLSAGKADAHKAAQRPALLLNAEAADIAGSGPYQGISEAEYTLGLSSVIEMGEKRDARHRRAISDYELTDAQQNAAMFALLSDVTRQFIATLALQEKLSIASDAEQLAAQTVQIVDERHLRGAAPTNDTLRAQAALARAQLTVTDLQHQLKDQTYRLRQFWRAESDDSNNYNASGDLYRSGNMPGFETLATQLDDALVMAVYASRERLARANVSLAKAQSHADIGWQIGITHYAGSNDQALSAGISVPLFSSDRSAAARHASRYRQEASVADYQASLRAVRSRLHQAWSDFNRHQAAVAVYRDDIIPQLQEATQEVRQGYQQGRYRYQDWHTVREELIQARRQMVDNAASALMNRTLIEELTATALTNHSKTEPKL